MLFPLILTVVIACQVQSLAVPNIAGCAIEYLNRNQIIDFTNETESFEADCEVLVTAEITKFYDDLHNLILSGVNVENLENSNFVNHERCILSKLKHFNVSDLYLKGIAYHKLEKAHRSDHLFNQRMTSQQILVLYALQLCEPRSFYARHAEKIFSLNMKTSDEQAHCLLSYLNAHNSGRYQLGDEIALVQALGVEQCNDIVESFNRKYYNVIDRARGFSIFGLNPKKVIKCRASNDKTLLHHMMKLTIFPRLTFTPEQMEQEKINFFSIAQDSARNFFHCIAMYD